MLKSLALSLSVLLLAQSAIRAQGNPECTAVTKPIRAKIAPSSANPQYFRYNNATQALVGASNEYLCHVVQPGTFGTPPLTPSVDYCAFNNYRDYIDFMVIGSITSHTIPSISLNVMQLWLSLNSSPGTDLSTKRRPYDHEAPFTNNCGPWPTACTNPVWNVGVNDDVFFNRLKCVLNYAWSRDVIVEVTIFDPWQGNFSGSPWKNSFSQAACFASKDFVVSGTTRCSDIQQNQNGWTAQRNLIAKIASTLCAYPNVYYEVANEVDLTTIPGLSPSQVRSWHQDMTTALANADSGCGHYIAANFHDDGNLTSLGTSVKAVNAHYTAIVGNTTYGANELIRLRHNGGANDLNRIFGFNETKIVSEVTGNSFQAALTARAEAWEFMTSEGGIFDLFAERWQTLAGETQIAFEGLKLLRGLLAGVPLDRVSRSINVANPNAAPAWLVGVSDYPSTGSGSTRWGAMESPMTQAGDANVLYLHHSTLELNGFQRYHAIESMYGPEKLSVKLPAGTYLVEWIDTTTGAITNSTITLPVSGQQRLLAASPPYTYDIALRITRQ